jgi:hypothetical protein
VIQNFRDEYERYKILGQKTIDQVDDDFLNLVLSEDNNSIAVIVRHLSGNFISRFTDFLTTDGEKPWRKRDSEFENKIYSRKEIQDLWDQGWKVLRDELTKLTDSDLEKQVTIRGQIHTVHEALCRSISHIAYHVGQIVLLGRIRKGSEWKSLSIPRGKSEEFNRKPTMEKRT